jgi:hypothetical protein
LEFETDLLGICKGHILPEDANVVIREPYIPFIPNPWNRVLVLAESQNLSKGSDSYLRSLNALSAVDRMRRLGNIGNDVGVYPWDDGSLKIAIQAAFELNPEETAVSNAVLWSQRGSNDQNVNPDINLQDLSAEMWGQFLELLNPKLVICSGNISDRVINNVGWDGTRFKIRLPSRMAMSRMSGMFDEKDLLKRYPEVKKVVCAHPEWMGSNYARNKIFFACHVVSLTREHTAS